VIANGRPEGRLAENILVDRKMIGGEFRVGAVLVGHVPHVQDEMGRRGIRRRLGQHRIPNISLVNTRVAGVTQHPCPHRRGSTRWEAPSQKSVDWCHQLAHHWSPCPHYRNTWWRHQAGNRDDVILDIQAGLRNRRACGRAI
jgi:hypothetical protein